jgi:cytochrome c biogenesis protein CcdA
MLPGYISYYLGIKNDNIINFEMSKKNKLKIILKDGIIGGIICSIGIILILIIIGICISFFGSIIRNLIKDNLIHFNIIVGIILIIMGLIMYKNYNIKLPIKIKNAPIKKGYAGLFFYGILYSLASISCVIPLFIGLMLRAINSESMIEGILVFFSYSIGLSLLLIIITIIISTTKYTIIKKINNILPIIQKIGSLILIFVGIWILFYYYQALHI